MGRNILIATKGLDELIPEMLGVFNFNNNCDFYENHPEKDAIRKKFNILPITDLWLVGTDSSRKDTDCTERFLSLLGSSAPKLKRWVLKDVDDIYSEENNSQYNDLVLRVVALAKNIVRKEKGQLTLSLAGGRKTMSASMQNAALYFGCDCIMHVLAKTPKVSANDFLHMTKEEFETAGIFPLNLGKQDGNEIFNDLLELSCVDELMRCGDPDDKEVKWQGDREFEKKVENRISQSRFFYTNYFLKNDENGTDTFKLLFTLPISVRNWLKEKYVGADVSSREHDMQLLSSMPKTELHCHLGGVLNPAEMVEVALSVKDEVEALKKRNKVFAQWLVEVADLASTPSKGWKEWRAEACKACFGNSEGSSDEDQALVVPAFLQLFENDVERLKRLVFGKYCDDEKEFRGITIAKYEALGDLQGSALLRHEKTLRKNIQVLLRNCHQHHVHYLEIRCTLPNYERVGLSKEHLVNVLLDELEKENDIKISLLFIASRHKTKVDIEELFHWVRGLQQNELFMKYFRGYDVAGDESLKKPEELRSAFCNAFQDCPNVTIHAGEDVDCENIWQAIYHLNAERIGHGLTLEDNHNLYRKVIERRIGVEMCPSSNAQIVGYRDNYIVGDEVKEYPLKRFLDGGLRVCVNTDDPGISLTNPTNERLMAGRLTKGGISLWDLLQMEYHALCAAFYPYEKKTLLMKDFEKKIQDWISENYNGNNR